MLYDAERKFKKIYKMYKKDAVKIIAVKGSPRKNGDTNTVIDALFSVDACHYFAGDPGFFREKILPFLNDGAVVCIGVPGMQEKYRGRAVQLLRRDAH